jgi:hypothetical protein
MRHRVMSVSLFLLATMVATLPLASATCSNASLTGVFGYFHGRPGGIGNNVHATLGQFTTDGAGNISAGSFTLSQGGIITTGNFTGTYSIAKNCTGTLTFSSEDATPAHFNITLDNGNHGFQIIQSDINYEQPGFGVSEGTVICGLTGKKQTFATNFAGTILSGDVPFSIVGQLTLNGTGSLSGNETESTNGGTTISTFPLEGTYTEKSNCNGTAQITPKGGTATNFNFVVVNGGKELLLIGTDSDTLVGGTAQH